MAPPPLVDLASIDLSRVVATRDEIYAVLRQRGRLALLDGIAHYDPDEPLAIAWKDIRADDWWAPDHIPGRPLFPGVLMIEAAAQLASWDYLRRSAGGDVFVGFVGVDETRFRGTVEPGVRFVLATRPTRVRSRTFVYAVSGHVEGKLVFETVVTGAIL